MSVTLINVFKLPEDQRDEFLKRWTETTQAFIGFRGGDGSVTLPGLR